MTIRNRCSGCKMAIPCTGPVIFGERGIYCSEACAGDDVGGRSLSMDPGKVVDRVVLAWVRYRAALDRACEGGNPMGGTVEYEEFRQLYVACAPEVLEEVVERRRAAAAAGRPKV